MSRCVLQVATVLPQDVRNQLLALEESKLLRTVVTWFSYADGGILDRLLMLADRWVGSHLVQRTAARRIDGPIACRVRRHLGSDLVRHWKSRFSRSGLGPRAADACQAAVDRLARSLVEPKVRLAIGREGACAGTFAATHAVGGRCLYDLPTAYYKTVRSILEKEEAEFPKVSLFDHQKEEFCLIRCRGKERELAAADHVLVASQFVRGTLLSTGVSPERITVIPYGCEPRRLQIPRTDRARRSRLVLYVGHLSLRKGIPRLLRAWKRLGAWRTYRLRLIGSMHLAPKFLANYTGIFEHLPSLPRTELWKHYAAAYAFVFPAAADGFGLVINEALASGLPVITSTHTGAPGFVTHGREGLLYPFGDDDKLCSALDQLLSCPEQAAEMGRAAFQLAAGWTWRDYHVRFGSLVMQFLDAPALRLSPSVLKLEASHGR